MTAARILVLCTANVARSPLGAAILRAHARHLLGPSADEIEVDSAGVNARTGDPAAPGSIACAAGWGIDLSAHRSKPVSPELLEAADLVITMSTRQRKAVLGESTGAAARTFTWPELVRLLGSADVPAAGTASMRLRAAVQAAHYRRPFDPPPKRAEDVDDPFGGPIDGFVAMANELADGGDVLGPRLFAVTQRHGVTV